MEISDQALIAAYRKGDEGALETLVERYLPLIYGYARRYTGNADQASDIAQETFVRVWRSLHRYDMRKSFRAWIFTIAKNVAIDWLREKKAVPFSMMTSQDEESHFADTIADDRPPLIDQVSQTMARRRFNLALNQLPTQYAYVINLRTLDDLTFQQIAQRLKEPLNTVKSRYRRGLIFLKKLLPRKADL